jgi:hypothetical protein
MLTMRFLTVFFLILMIKTCNRKKALSLDMTEVSLVGFSGMIRGSIAYALVVKLADDIDPSSDKLPVAVCISQIVIALTMYIFTPLNPILFNVLLGGANSNDGESDDHNPHGKISLAEERPASKTILLQKRADLVNKKEPKFKVVFKRLDEFVIKPMLIRNYEERVVVWSSSAQNQGRKEEDLRRRSGGGRL